MTRESLQRHMNAIQHGDFKCSACPEVFRSQSARRRVSLMTRESLQRHMNAIQHGDFKCSACPEVFRSQSARRRVSLMTRESLQRHMTAIHHGGFKCSACPEVFRSQSARHIHNRVHHATLPPIKVCMLCFFVFSCSLLFFSTHTSNQISKNELSRVAVRFTDTYILIRLHPYTSARTHTHTRAHLISCV